ncbi:MAG: trigger factor [Nannocystaceae bacterium]
MESQLERISPVECRVRVQIAWDDVLPKHNRKLRELQTRVRMPGFRKGKVPPAVLERLYGAGMREELSRDLVSDTFKDAVAQHNTVPLTDPVLEKADFEKGQPFEYAARFEVTPQIQLKKYKGLSVRRRPASADPEKLEAHLVSKQEELAEIRPLPEALDRETTQDGDVWTVDADGSFGSQHISVKDVDIEIGSAAATFVPGLEAQLRELKLAEVGDTRKLRFVPPQDSLRPDFKGLEVELTVGLRQVREKVRPVLDDEFARDTGDAESMDELRRSIEGRLLEEDTALAERDARHRLVTQLLELNPFDPAPSMITREVEGQVERFKSQLRRQGITLAQLNMSEAQVAHNVRPEAVFNVSGFLLLDAIGRAESIWATEKEVTEEVEEMAKEQGKKPARLRATMEKSQELLLLRAQIRESKILDFLMENTDVTEAPDPEPEDADGVNQAPDAPTASDDRADVDPEADGGSTPSSADDVAD